MNVEVRKAQERAVVRIDGDVDMYVGTRLRDVIMATLTDEVRVLILDVTTMQYVDSSGIALFVDLRDIMQQRSGSFGLLNRPGAIDSHVKRTSLGTLFQCIGSEAEIS